jgi:hypothetical protein
MMSWIAEVIGQRSNACEPLNLLGIPTLSDQEAGDRPVLLLFVPNLQGSENPVLNCLVIDLRSGHVSNEATILVPAHVYSAAVLPNACDGGPPGPPLASGDGGPP